MIHHEGEQPEQNLQRQSFSLCRKPIYTPKMGEIDQVLSEKKVRRKKKKNNTNNSSEP
jgi:hypothetical protein